MILNIFYWQQCFSYLQSIHLKRKPFRQNTIYNSFCLKKTLVLIRKMKIHLIKTNYLNYKHLIWIETIHFDLKKKLFSTFFFFFVTVNSIVADIQETFLTCVFSKNIFAFNLKFSLVGRERPFELFFYGGLKWLIVLDFLALAFKGFYYV